MNSAKKDAKIFASRTGKKWVDSKLIDYCAECDQKFTMINRKHHCRQCGEVICSACSPDRVIIGRSHSHCHGDSDSTPVRVCRSCHIEHQKFTRMPNSCGGNGTDANNTTGGDPHSSRDPAHHGVHDFHGRYQKIKSCYTTKSFQYGPSMSQYFVLHIPREDLTAVAASQANMKFRKSVPIIVLVHGGFWRFKYGIDNSNIDSLISFFLAKGMAVCQVEYRRVGCDSKENIESYQSENYNHQMTSPHLSVSPTFLQLYPPYPVHMQVSSQFQTVEDIRSRRGSACSHSSQSSHGSHGDGKHLADDEGGFPKSNEDLLQALRLLHHKCGQMNANATGVDSFTHHYIAANGSRCISGLAKLDTSRIVLLGHSAGGYLALWTSCRLQERKLPFQPLLCVAVAPVCNLAEAHGKGVGGSAVENFLTPALQAEELATLSLAKSRLRDSPPLAFTSDNIDIESSLEKKRLTGPFLNLLPAACPSQQLPVEVPCILACGTTDSDVPLDSVEDFYWKAKEYAVINPPPISFSPQHSRRTPEKSTTSVPALTAVEKLNQENSLRYVPPTSRKDDLSAAFVRDSISVPIKLLKLQDTDHYAPVLADHPSFLKIFDEMFVIAPGLADIPELEILTYHPNEVRLAMEYHSNSKSSSRNSNEVCNHNLSTASEKSTSKNNLEDIFEDDCTNSSVGDLSARNSHGNSWRESNASQQSAVNSRQSKCDSFTATGSNTSPLVDSRIPECMQLIDNDELQVDKNKPYSYSSSDDDSITDAEIFASNVTPNNSQTRKCRTNTQDSRDSVEKEDASKQEQESKVKRRTMSRRDSTDTSQPASDTGEGEKVTEDLEFFSFPAPVNKTKRRSFILPKFM